MKHTDNRWPRTPYAEQISWKAEWILVLGQNTLRARSRGIRRVMSTRMPRMSNGGWHQRSMEEGEGFDSIEMYVLHGDWSGTFSS